MSTALARFRMGDTGADDLPDVVSQGQFAQQAWTEEEARKTFTWAKLAQSARAKCAFMSELSKTIMSDAALLDHYRSTKEGEAYLQALIACRRLFENITQPNVFKTTQNLVNALEINILPAMGIGVYGITPLYVNGATSLAWAKTDTRLPSRPKTIDFGDLHKTKLVSDLQLMAEAAKELNVPIPSLGAIPVVVGKLIGIFMTWILMPTIVGISVYAAIRAFKDPPTLPPELRLLPPERRDMLIEKISTSNDVMTGVVDTLKWLAIGAGIIVVGGATIFVALKD